MPLERELVQALDDLRPREDRDPTSPVFPDFSAQGFRLAMERACRAAGIPHYHPHDLRHRYISLLVAAGLPITLVQRVVGHSRASMTLDAYSHVLVDEPAHRLAQLRRGVLGVFQGPPNTTPKEKSPAQTGLFDDMEHSGFEPLTSWVRSRRSPS